MRILHIIAQKPGETGSGIFLKNLVQVGARKGYEQCVVAGIGAGESYYSESMPQGVLFYPVYFETEELPFPVPGMSDVMPYKSTRYSEMTETMIFLWEKAFKNALTKAAAFQPDVIIMHHLWLLAVLVREFFPALPMIGICHSTELRQLVNAWKFRNDVIKGCRKIDRIAALSPFQKQAIREVYGIEGDRIAITGGGFAQELFRPAGQRVDDGKIRILYVGKICSAKGVPSLLRAVTGLPVERDRIQLILVGAGNGPEYEEIMDLIRKCPFDVEMKGRVSQEALAQIMGQCHIFVLSSFYEGLSLVTLEALASGLRVVANDLPGMRECVGPVLEKKGIIVYVAMPELYLTDVPVEAEMPAYEERLKQALIRQINAAQNNPQISLDGWHEMAKKYSWKEIFNSIEKIYHDLVQDK